MHHDTRRKRSLIDGLTIIAATHLWLDPPTVTLDFLATATLVSLVAAPYLLITHFNLRTPSLGPQNES